MLRNALFTIIGISYAVYDASAVLLDIPPSTSAQFARAVMSLGHLQSLNLSGASGMLTKVIPIMDWSVLLANSGCEMNAAATDQFCNMIRKNTSLTSLNLHGILLIASLFVHSCFLTLHSGRKHA